MRTLLTAQHHIYSASRLGLQGVFMRRGNALSVMLGTRALHTVHSRQFPEHKS